MNFLSYAKCTKQWKDQQGNSFVTLVNDFGQYYNVNVRYCRVVPVEGERCIISLRPCRAKKNAGSPDEEIVCFFGFDVVNRC